MEILDVTDKLVIDHRARDWCKLPYPDHPKGCPNFGKKSICPPQVATIEEWLENTDELRFACVSFNLKEHAGRMLERNPHWSQRQARCLLYWQPKVNKALRSLVDTLVHENGLKITYCPEAMGVNVIKTAQSVGIPIEAPPKDIVHKIALVATNRDGKAQEK